ncbi:MAG: hypothetical protein V3S69_01615, partial [Dehalococcoidales bacterium]
LPGSVSKPKPKPALSSLELATNDLKELLEAQSLERKELTQTLKQLSVSIVSGNAGSVDLEAVVKSIEAMTQSLQKPSSDYKLSGKRDKNGLIDLNSIKFTATNRKS